MPGVEIVIPDQPPRAPESGGPARPSYALAMARGLGQRCPRCGRGRLFRAYLKPVDACGSCGEPLGHIRADDAPPYFTIFIVGHVVVGLILSVEIGFHPPMWVHMATWPALTVVLTLALLPVVKGALIGLMWRLKLRGDEFQ
jgi:uncharacterized protein (DUF983 family)